MTTRILDRLLLLTAVLIGCGIAAGLIFFSLRSFRANRSKPPFRCAGSTRRSMTSLHGKEMP